MNKGMELNYVDSDGGKQERAGCALVRSSPKPGTRAGPTTDPTVPPCVENQP